VDTNVSEYILFPSSEFIRQKPIDIFTAATTSNLNVLFGSPSVKLFAHPSNSLGDEHEHTPFSCFQFVHDITPHLHDASLLERVKSRECARRRFMQVMRSSAGLTLKLVADSILLA
jgi:hypothetical protein